MYTLSFQNSTQSSHFLFICRPYFVISRCSTKIIPLHHTSMCSAHFNYLPIFSGLREVVIIACGTGSQGFVHIYIYIYIYICYGFQLVNQFNQVSYGYICHSFSYNNITNWKEWKGIPKKKKNTLFFFN